MPVATTMTALTAPSDYRAAIFFPELVYECSRRKNDSKARKHLRNGLHCIARVRNQHRPGYREGEDDGGRPSTIEETGYAGDGESDVAHQFKDQSTERAVPHKRPRNPDRFSAISASCTLSTALFNRIDGCGGR